MSAYTVAGWSPGVAWRVLGPVELVDEWGETELDPELVRVVMVGDDRVFVVDRDDLNPLDELDYCAECGQVGCAHDGRER